MSFFLNATSESALSTCAFVPFGPMGGPSLMTFPEYIQGDKLLGRMGEGSNASPFFYKALFLFSAQW